MRKLEQDYWQHIARLDADSMRDLIETYGQAVWNYAFLMTKRHDMADDIAQDVFLQVYRSIDTYRGQSSMKTWLFAITRNKAFNYRRSAFFRKVMLVDWITRQDSGPSAETEVLDQELTGEVWKLVMQLPSHYREVLILEAKYELSLKEMAHVLGVAEGTIKSRLSRARKKMNDMWKGAGTRE
ncbi:RNA polymerase sigma factor [Paenibacillus sp. HJGM_3]|uniref:RNA polymerase sigma factor n=1 Tax=Paenibacillus sp. HJGM_3 TaxID=3379816 RepID=UPI00385E12F1